MEEPRYAGSFDGDGNYSELSTPGVPKWRVPATPWQRRVLSAVGLTLWPKSHGDKDLRTKFLVIEKSLQPLGAIEPKYPTEFVDSVIDWYRSKRLIGRNMLVGMLRSFDDSEWRARVIMDWRKKHPDVTPRSYDEELPPQKEWKDE